MRFLFLCFLTVPIIEMLLLIEVGSVIGTFYTILLVLMTAAIGVSLLKRQGLSTLLRANNKMQSGQMPVAEMGEGMMLAIAGALLLTPGFVTDTVGFLLLNQGVRNTLARRWIQQLAPKVQGGFEFSQTQYRSDSQPRSATGRPFPDSSKDNLDIEIIEGEYQEVSSEKRQIKNNSVD